MCTVQLGRFTCSVLSLHCTFFRDEKRQKCKASFAVKLIVKFNEADRENEWKMDMKLTHNSNEKGHQLTSAVRVELIS